MKACIKINKKIIKFGDTQIEKQEFQQHESSILINNIDINKIVVSNRVSFGEKGFKHFIGYKYAKKIVLYACFFQKCVYIKETLMKQNICLF